MIKIQLSKIQAGELQAFRRRAAEKNSQRALMVLMSAEGKTVRDIAKQLKKNPHTVRRWLKRFQLYGISGLQPKPPPGRPSKKSDRIKEILEEAISHSPDYYGVTGSRWTISLLVQVINANYDISTSKDTILRTLKKLGYRYERPMKTKQRRGLPDRKKKIDEINYFIGQIKKMMEQNETIIHALDESYASPDAHLPSGWSLKRWPPKWQNASEAAAHHIIWMLEYRQLRILLEKIERV